MRAHAVVAAALLLAACAGSRSAAGRGGGDANGAALATEAGEVVGIVAEVDRDAGTVSIASGDMVRTVRLAAEAAVEIDGFDGAFEDVQEGQAIRAALDDVGSGVEVVRIDILNQGVPVAAEAPPQE
jgi:hypothetical protein